MKQFCALALLLAMASSAAAQSPLLPRTVPFTDAQGLQIGTATFSGNRIFLRDLKGELIAQIVINPDGSKALLDIHGSVLDRLEGKLQ